MAAWFYLEPSVRIIRPQKASEEPAEVIGQSGGEDKIEGRRRQSVLLHRKVENQVGTQAVANPLYEGNLGGLAGREFLQVFGESRGTA